MGDEIYFTTNILVEENARETVEKCTIAFWPPGSAICIFWNQYLQVEHLLK